MKVEVQITQGKQIAIPELGRKEKILSYLIIGEGENKTVINIGEKTYESIKSYLEDEQKELGTNKGKIEKELKQ